MVGGSLHWDILRLYHELKQGILKAKETGISIDSIGIDTWGVDFGLLDKNDVLLGNPYHYRDSYTDGMIEEALRVVSRERIYKDTGIAFQKFNTLYQLLALVKINQHCLKMRNLALPDLLNFLTGNKSCEFTIASTSQMLLAGRGTWAYDLLNELGIPIQILPEIIDSCNFVENLENLYKMNLE